AAPIHGSADVEHDARAEVRLLLVLFYHPAIGARGDLPIDVSRLVSRLIGTILGELHRESLAGRTVEPGQETSDDPSSHDFDPTERCETSRVEKVGAERAFHEPRKVTGRRVGPLYSASAITLGPFRFTEIAVKLDHIRNFCIVAHIDHGK